MPLRENKKSRETRRRKGDGQGFKTTWATVLKKENLGSKHMTPNTFCQRALYIACHFLHTWSSPECSTSSMKVTPFFCFLMGNYPHGNSMLDTY